jgi:hypothetical protein
MLAWLVGPKPVFVDGPSLGMFVAVRFRAAALNERRT